MRTLGDLGEFGVIDRIQSRLGGARGRCVALGIGDDAALLRPKAGEQIAVTTDALVEGVHFRWESESPSALGRRLLAVNLSDLAAMGARPLACTLALAAPASLSVSRLDGIAKGLGQAATEYACPLVGGNVSAANETSLTLTAMGGVEPRRALRRDGARAGDRLYVTGSLGGAALAWIRSERNPRTRRPTPTPRIEAGRALGRMTTRGACIDLSDGLGADLPHLLAPRGLGAEIDLDRLPRPAGFDRRCRRLGVDPAALLVGGGEDYELLFSLRPQGPSAAALTRRLGVAVTEIGRVTRKPGVRGIPETGGWRHF